jgi:Leucine-rich repeat (LRR) protein
LVLGGNQISSLEDVVFPTSLTRLDLCNNNIRDFSHIFPYLNQLKYFRYDINKLKTQEELITEKIGNKRKII